MTADAVGGVWRYALDLCAAWRRRDIHVTLAVMGPRPTPRQSATAVALGVDLVTCPFKLEWMDDAWGDVDRAGEWLLDLEQRTAPDVVHLNGFCHGSLPWRVPTIVVAHSCVCSWWRGVHGHDAPRAWTEYRARVIAGLRSARIVVAPSAGMMTALVREYRLGLSDARVIPNGAGRASEPAAVSRKARFVFAAGRVWDRAKNIRALCDIAPSIAWPVYIAGASAVPATSERVEFEVPPQATLLGQLDPIDLDRWLDRAAIYALPAKYEPFGLSILEAASAGCALVLGDIPSLRENWSGAALFVPPDDRQRLTRALQRLIDDEGERTTLARCARERAARFSLERMASDYITAYRDAIDMATPITTVERTHAKGAA